MTPLSTRMVEAAARAMWTEFIAQHLRSEDWPTWGELLAQGHQGLGRVEQFRSLAHAALTAALALAEAEGAVLCVVPAAAGNGSVTLTHWQQGYNICRDDFLRRSVRIAP